MIDIQAAFAPSYARARVLFLEGAAAAGMAIRSHNAERLLIVSSACHGAEGFCGSGVQVYATHDQAWRQHAREAGVAVLYIHALNPYGFSHLRRVTNENVDLNRNFQDFSQPLPVNTAYAGLHDLLLPPEWPPGPDNAAAIDSWIALHGETAYQAAVSQGQHAFADGLFFGGTAPTWSNQTLRQVLRNHAQRARHIAWIDLHTGLGPSWWGSNGETPVTSIYDGSSTSALLTGLMWGAMYEECPQAGYTGIALEYGTVPIMEVINALRGDHWLNRHPEAPAALRAAIHQRMKDAFYVDTDAWRTQIVGQGRQALFQAVDGLIAST